MGHEMEQVREWGSSAHALSKNSPVPFTRHGYSFAKVYIHCICEVGAGFFFRNNSAPGKDLETRGNVTVASLATYTCSRVRGAS